jgi:hypothetical protein
MARMNSTLSTFVRHHTIKPLLVLPVTSRPRKQSRPQHAPTWPAWLVEGGTDGDYSRTFPLLLTYHKEPLFTG